MTAQSHLFELDAAPHWHGGNDIDFIMRQVIMALLPICAFSVWQFGLSGLALLATCTLVCLVTEQFFNFMAATPSTLRDGSAAITGILLSMSLPPGFPLCLGGLGAFLAIALGKALFGGLGGNLFNPTLVGRAILQISFPAAITTWTPAFVAGRFTAFVPSSLAVPFCEPPAIEVWLQGAGVEGFSASTPLALEKITPVGSEMGRLLLGMSAGFTGETCVLLVLLAGAWLAWRKILNWRIPVAVLGSAFLVSAMFHVIAPSIHPYPVLILLSGGFVLGAVFMATDPMGAPVTPLGLWIYGGLIGTLAVLIRLKVGLSEGIMIAILLGNAMTPLIERWTQPRVFGKRKEKHV